jgi:hypothetical protein
VSVPFLNLVFYDSEYNLDRFDKKKQTFLHKLCQGTDDAAQMKFIQLIGLSNQFDELNINLKDIVNDSRFFQRQKT